MVSNPYRQYQTTQVQTAGPAQLTLMCYDGILRYLAQGREAIGVRNYHAKSLAFDKAQALLGELIKGLDFERGGDVARNLSSVYHYLFDQLTNANLKDDVAIVDEIRVHVTELRSAWAEAMALAGPTRGATEAPRREFALSI